jgi:hypothetical protein
LIQTYEFNPNHNNHNNFHHKHWSWFHSLLSFNKQTTIQTQMCE